MLHDFGMYCHDMLNQRRTKIKTTDPIMKKLEEIDNAFDLILIADEEHYDEGMVLLKHALCWEYEDIINVPHNVFSETKKSYYSVEARKIIKDWLWQDYILYDHYKTQFKKKVNDF